MEYYFFMEENSLFWSINQHGINRDDIQVISKVNKSVLDKIKLLNKFQ